LRHIDATVSAAILLTEPVFAVMIAYPLLHEFFQPVEMLGALLLLVALCGISWQPGKRAS
jgi:drug/metabolite transporter (DMT)-like permease